MPETLSEPKPCELSEGVPAHVSALILAAGEGKRIGGSKALIALEKQPLVLHIARRLEAVGYRPVLPVVNETVDAALEGLEEWEHFPSVVNPDPASGALMSIRIGLGALPDPGCAVLLLPVDHPFVSNRTLAKLRDHAAPNRIVIPTYEGKRGHPPLFGQRFLRLLFDIPLEEGARGVYARLEPGELTELEVDDPGVLMNVNTPAEWEKGLAWWISGE